jgi:hypothetical protein
MVEAGSLDIDEAERWVIEIVGEGEGERVEKLEAFRR